MANYIKYGNVDVDLEAYLKAIADNAETYLASQPWSSKQKDRWRKAYSDIVSRGITGASVATEGLSAGKWLINYGGLSIPIETMLDKDRRAYQDAAYFLKSQMESLSSSKQLTEQELPVFDNKTFTEGLTKLITNNLFGGRSWNTQEHWNIKDERDSTGKRGTTNRAKLLAEQLELYRDSLEEGKYNFEGSPFLNLNDFKTRITEAITALRTPDPNDDVDPLNRIGLRARDYLYNGLDDVYGTDSEGNKITYALRNRLLEAQLATLGTLLLEETPTVEAPELPGFKSIERSNLTHFPMTLLLLSKKFNGDLNSAKTYLQSLAEKSEKMTWDDWRVALGMFNLHKNELENLSEDELSLFKSLERYKDLSPDRLKKIKGINGIYLDTKTNQVVRPSFNELSELESIFAANKPLTEEEFLNSEIPGLTSADKKDLWAIGLDIASILYPGAAGGAILGASAAELRREALVESGHKWGIWDILGQGLDYITGFIGGVPIVGDTILGVKTAANVTKAVAKLTPILRKMARAGAWIDIYLGLPSSTQAVWDKIVKGESLTVGDWKDLGQLIRGLAGHRALNRGNLAERRVLEKSGYDLSGANKFSLRIGLSRTVLGVPEEQITNTLKIKVDGKETEIKLSDKSVEQLKKAFKNAGRDKTKRDDAIKLLKEVREKYKLDEKVVEEAPKGETPKEGEVKEGETPKKEEKATPKIEAMEANWQDYERIPGFLRRNPITSNNRSWIRKKFDLALDMKPRGVNPSNLKSVVRGEDKFEEYLTNRNTWDRIKYGTNRDLRKIREGIDMSVSLKLTPLTPDEAKVLKEKVKDLRKEYKDIFNINSNKGREHIWSLHSVEANPESLKTSVKLGNKELKIEIASDGTLILNGERTSINGFGGKGQGKVEVRKKIKEITKQMIKELRLERNTAEFSKLVLELRKLKSSGFLKYGGKIDNDEKLLNIIKDVNI